jgi:type IV pilus assembly protein PilV
LIEVMTAVAVMTVGATGLVLMQGATTRGNMQAQESTVAVIVAQNWIERLKRESLAWTAAGFPITPNLSQPPSIPYLAQPTFGTAESAFVDHFGFDTNTPTDAKFNVRLQNTVLHVSAPTEAAPGLLNGIRVDVTVYWFRSPGNSNDARVGSLLPDGYTPGTLVSDSILRSPQTRKIYASVVVQPNAGLTVTGP